VSDATSVETGADTDSDGTDPVVDVDSVTFAYGDTVALEDVSLTIRNGDFLGLIGPNGSGKTTLLHLIVGLKTPDEGSIQLFGEPVEAFQAGERIGYVAQRSTDRSESMPVSVREAVLMGRFSRTGHRRISEDDQAKVDEAIAKVGITDLADRPIGTLSGGQRQRAFIARAIASEADLLALDEPTVGVDAESRTAFYDLLGDLNDKGITIILIEHDVDILTDHANSVACLNRRLYHHGDTVSFLESDAIEEAYGTSSRLLAHDHP
jgi:zinc transport system ATP-binding protein